MVHGKKYKQTSKDEGERSTLELLRGQNQELTKMDEELPEAQPEKGEGSPAAVNSIGNFKQYIQVYLVYIPDNYLLRGNRFFCACE